MKLPESFLNSLTGIKGFDRESFEHIHNSKEQITSIRVNPAKTVAEFTNFSTPITPVPWTQYGFYLPARPSFTFDPLFHAGCYYVQEASSMFLERALQQTVDLTASLKVLDLCASPGGKSTHIQSLINSESFLVSNDVIRSRAGVLKDNIIKWGSSNVVVTNNDPKDFERLENYFDVIVADAPCSGSGLFRKDPDAIEEWSEKNVQLCSQRQQRIIADCWPSLKKGGVLIYSTCSYSTDEDENIVEWLVKEMEAENCQLLVDESWNITEVKTSAGAFCYRFWPDRLKGEGFFIAAFRKTTGEAESSLKRKNKPQLLTANDELVVKNWLAPAEYELIKNLNTVYAWPKELAYDFGILLNRMRVIYSGTMLGELIREKLIPDHTLAMSTIINEEIPKLALTLDESIAYLQRKELKIAPVITGWQLVTYGDYPLGWINALQNRINNYYPKELRILKDNL